MKRLLWLICFVFVSFMSVAEKNPAFNSGRVVLHNGDTLVCKLRFTRKVSEGLLQILSDDKVQILTVHQVYSFSFFDEKRNKERHFSTVYLKPELSSRSHEVFAEVLHENDAVAVINHRTMGYAKKWEINPFRKKTANDNYYLLEKETHLVLPLSKENILAVMNEDRSDIQAFLENSTLKFRQVSDYITVLDYQQSLR
jgi:hypothetical protein